MSKPRPGIARFLDGLRRGQALRRSRSRRFAFCTIATEDFLPWTLVLFDSLERHHPGAERVLLYVRQRDEASRAPVIEGVRVIAVDDLVAATHEADLRRRYNMPELCFALKPALLRHCLDQGAERAVYLDSDLDILSPLDQASIELEMASIVLTPHLDTPLAKDGKLPSEITISRAGTFNAGFVAVAASEEALSFLAWWDSRVSHWGFVAPESGFQGDQKWLDLVPSLFQGAAILRDPGSNLGYWNLRGRPLEHGEGGAAIVNGSRLAFVHFSGFDPERPGILSRYQNRFSLAEQPILAAIAIDYAARLVGARPSAAALRWQARPENRIAVSAPPSLPPLEGPMTPEAYRPAIEAKASHHTYVTGEEIEVHVRITNTSATPWAVSPAPDGSGGIALSYHLLDAHEQPLRWDHPRYPLPSDVAPGASVDMVIGIRAPSPTGRYWIELDLIHEGAAWFSLKGGDTARFPVVIGIVENPT